MSLEPYYGYDKSLSGQLAHHGVKGMRWGVRRKNQGGGGVPRRKTTNADIHNARVTMNSQRAVRNNAAHNLNTISYRNSDKTDIKQFSKKDRVEFDKNAKLFKDSSNVLFDSRDAIVARRCTTGEAVVATLLTGPIGASYVAGNRIYTGRRLKKWDQAHQGQSRS